MRALSIGVGNPLRRDDGAAHAVLERIGAIEGVETLGLAQLAPEVAAEMAGYDTVVFVDADAGAVKVEVEPLCAAPAASAFTHVLTPEEIVELSRAAFGFSGRALLCRIPAEDFEFGEGLSGRTEEFAAEAARELQKVFGGGGEG